MERPGGVSERHRLKLYFMVHLRSNYLCIYYVRVHPLPPRIPKLPDTPVWQWVPRWTQKVRHQRSEAKNKTWGRCCCCSVSVSVPASAGCPTDRRSVHLKYLIRVYCTILSVPNHLSQAKWRENSLRHHTTGDDVNEPPSMDPGQGSGSQSISREKGGTHSLPINNSLSRNVARSGGCRDEWFLRRN